jgi:hypothetical protein
MPLAKIPSSLVTKISGRLLSLLMVQTYRNVDVKPTACMIRWMCKKRNGSSSLFLPIMKNKLTNFLGFVFVFFSLVTCKHTPVIDPNGPQCGEATTIDEMMDWVYFKTGSYWIYEEQNSGDLDTFTVYYDYSGVSNTGNREFVVKMRSSRDGYTYEYWFNDAWSGDCSLFPGCFCRAVDCDKYIPGDYAGGNHVFAFPLKLGSQVWQSGGGQNFGSCKIINHSSTEIIYDNEFFNVFEFKQDFSPQHGYQKSNYKLAADIGIIEKSIPHLGECWKLKQYETIQ